MLLTRRPEGLYCEAGDFFVDPWRPVARAVITHAHADHARPGHGTYLAAAPAEGVLRARLGPISLGTLAYGEALDAHGVRVSLHPAGHVLGSAQVRIEHRGEVWVVSGDYKVEPDPTCAPFEPVRCHTFVTESTFGLPIYRWAPSRETFASIDAWWRANADAGRASVLFCYAFGKAQRILAGVDASIGPIVCHGAIEPLNRAYRAAGVALPDTCLVSEVKDRAALSRALVLAPPSAGGTSWMRRFPDPSDAFASGWMAVRGARRRRSVDRGFVLSDHADWPGLNAAIAASGAARVFVTHGQVAVMMRWLEAQGLDARAFETEFGGEDGAALDDAGAATEAGAEPEAGGASDAGAAPEAGGALPGPGDAGEAGP
jgi:putative mRNA 3-end processing factor